MTAALALVVEPEPIHLRHFKDGYPLCWPMDRDGEFQGTFTDSEVTCSECVAYLQETTS